MFEKVSVLMSYPKLYIIGKVHCSFVIVCTAPIMTEKDILEFLQAQKISSMKTPTTKMVSIDDNAVPVPASSEIRNIMKSMRSFLDAHFKDHVAAEGSRSRSRKLRVLSLSPGATKDQLCRGVDARAYQSKKLLRSINCSIVSEHENHHHI
ncbi:hypothetical protein TNCV_3077351 [Trichonephila clavipes]|nr:hypothetical protein TNCV_3077351 [Trichonephila clavipes]